MDAVLRNGSTFCPEIKRLAPFKNNLVFADSGARQINSFDPVDKAVTVVVGCGQEGVQDGTAKSCSFVQRKVFAVLVKHCLRQTLQRGK